MSWQNTTKKVSGAIAVIAGLWMALTVGLGDVFNIIARPDEVSAATAASLGGIDFIDRIAVLGIVVTIAGSAGLGLLDPKSKDNLPFVSTTLTYLPVIVAFISFSAFGSEAVELLTGDRVWANYDDIANSYMLFLASSMVSGVVSLLKK
jgi:hypothetical protein